MSITINHQTNDISSTSGSLTIDGAAIGGGGGALEFISKTTISSSITSVELTGLTSHTNYLVVFNIGMGTGARFMLQLSEDNGLTYKTNGCFYTYQKAAVSSVTVGEVSNAGTSMYLDGSGSVSQSVNGTALLMRCNQTTDFSALFDFSQNLNDSKRYINKTVVGVTSQSTKIDAIKLHTTYGNFEDGAVLLYGLKES
tara:strand:+ start:31 stop:624 length:594 start_codon:yes stop_codon:yes gene_type:complete